MDETSDRRNQILDAAFDEFASKGFKGATIKSIALRAKLQSQALIYWYFPTKEALFQEVIGKHLPILQVIRDPQEMRDRPPEEVLSLLAQSYLTAAESPGIQRLVRLIVPEAIRRPEMIDLVSRLIIARVLDFLKTYLARQIKLGRLRPHDVRTSSRAFAGMILPQFAGKLFIPALRSDGLTDEEYIQAIVEIFLKGLSPEE